MATGWSFSEKMANLEEKMNVSENFLSLLEWPTKRLSAKRLMM
jgi:hypothetical protein